MIGFKSHSGDTQSSRPRKAHDNPVYRSLYGSASRISFFATCTKSRLFGHVVHFSNRRPDSSQIRKRKPVFYRYQSRNARFRQRLRPTRFAPRQALWERTTSDVLLPKRSGHPARYSYPIRTFAAPWKIPVLDEIPSRFEFRKSCDS
jgi:hypothetical protein